MERTKNDEHVPYLKSEAERDTSSSIIRAEANLAHRLRARELDDLLIRPSSTRRPGLGRLRAFWGAEK
jgi:hypothetical protein